MNEEMYFSKPLPGDSEAEKIIATAIMLNPSLVYKARAMIQPGDFQNINYRRMLEAEFHILDTVKDGLKMNPVSVSDAMKILGYDGELTMLGGTAGLNNQTFGVPKMFDITSYLKSVKDSSQKRKAILLFNKAQNDIYDGKKSLNEVFSAIVNHVTTFDFADEQLPRSSEEVGDSVLRMLDEWSEGNEEKYVVKSSLDEMNALLKNKGYTYGNLILIGARPSMGKTALLLQEMRNASAFGVPTLTCTFEMSDEELYMRMAPALCGVRHIDINPYNIRINKDLKIAVQGAVHKLKKLPMYFDEVNKTAAQLAAMIRRYVMEKGVRVVGIDYLQLMKITGRHARLDQEYGEILSILKNLAKELGILIILLVQLNRGPENEDRRPEMNDIREAGNAEQDADVVAFLYNPLSKKKKLGVNLGPVQEVNSGNSKLDSEAEIMKYIAKQRNGPAGDNAQVKLIFDKDLQIMMTETMLMENTIVKFGDERNYG